MTAISGIGPWTADVYLLFCLGHRDGFAAGDLAIQEAARNAFGLAERPKPAELAAMAEAWRHWRGVAARLLPRALLDRLYDFVARVRYRVFGRKPEVCPVIPKELRSRFEL